jgi:hypothetical protein
VRVEDRPPHHLVKKLARGGLEAAVIFRLHGFSI